MGLLDWLFGKRGGDKANPYAPNAPETSSGHVRPARGARPGAKVHDLDELARRLGMSMAELRGTPIKYQEFTIPKRNGKLRNISAPEPALRAVQERIHRRLLRRLKAHDAAMAYERGKSIVTHAAEHCGKAVVVRIDLRDFFPSIKAARVRAYFERIGWDSLAAKVLTELCTHKGSLPQGAPTSPRLSNLVNRELDARLSGLAREYGAAYTRYADDITYSFESDVHLAIGAVVNLTSLTLHELEYRMHWKRKLHIRRRSSARQEVTGLVVNEWVRLPRETRRWLRAVRHRQETTGTCTLTEAQLAGWGAYEQMVAAEGM